MPFLPQTIRYTALNQAIIPPNNISPAQIISGICDAWSAGTATLIGGLIIEMDPAMDEKRELFADGTECDTSSVTVYVSVCWRVCVHVCVCECVTLYV